MTKVLQKIKLFKWQGSSKIYTLPWSKKRIKYATDSEEIVEYTKYPFTRSRFVRTMISEFHLSENSIVVSNDDHARWLKRLSVRHMPNYKTTPEIAKDILNRIFITNEDDKSEHTIEISESLVREIYRMMLKKVLNVKLLKPLDDYITATRFPKNSRSLLIEGIMHSLRFHIPLLRPFKWFLETIFFRKSKRMKRIAKKLERMVFNFTIPENDSWFNELSELKNNKKITHAQFNGEITSMLVSSFSLASALGSTLICLAARPSYQKKIEKDPIFAKYFVMEVLRLYPPFRQFGYQKIIEKNDRKNRYEDRSEFMIPVVKIHRNKKEWKEPDKFYPERFLSSNSTKGLKYIPFGMGRRSCPGRKFTLLLLSESVKFICSEESKIKLVKRGKMPQGTRGRLVSFPIDDSLTYKKKDAV